MQIVTPLCVQHKFAYLNIYTHIILCLGCGVGYGGFCGSVGMGILRGIPPGFSVGMKWVLGLKSNPHGSLVDF